MKTSFLHDGVTYHVRARLARDTIVRQHLTRALLAEWADRQADAGKDGDRMPMVEWALLTKYVDLILTCSTDGESLYPLAAPDLPVDELYDYMTVFWDTAPPSFYDSFTRAQLMVDNGLTDPLD